MGPLAHERGGVKHIHCLLDSSTRMGDAVALRTINSTMVIRSIRRWISKYGIPKVLMTDNAAYYTPPGFDNWCKEVQIEHKFIAPYHHQSVGLVERYHQTLVDRIRRLKFINGGSWVDYLEPVVEALNGAIHIVTKSSPEDL